MDFKKELSPEQWKTLFNMPSAASTFVSLASGTGLEVIKEMFSASKFMQESAQKSGGSGYGSLVDGFVAAMKGMKPKEVLAETVQYQTSDLESIRAEAKQMAADGAAVLAALPESEGFKRWVLDMARRVCETKTGGVLGFGGTSVIDEKEQAALDELKTVFGL